MFYDENSNILNIYNEVKKSILFKMESNCEIKDTVLNENTKDIIALTSKSLDNHRTEAFFSLISNKSTKLRKKD